MIKRIDPKAVIKLVSSMDEAIDQEKSNLKKYAETLDVSHLVFKEASVPTFFLVGNIPHKDIAAIKNIHQKLVPPSVKDDKKIPGRIEIVDQSGMMVEYFSKGVKGVQEGIGPVVDKVDPETFPFEVIQEIGSYVMLRTVLGDMSKKD